MAPSVLDSQGSVPASLLAPLKAHLPHSFAVLRRAQFTHISPHSTSPHAHFLFASDPAYPGSPSSGGGGGSASPPQLPAHFAAAYLDLSAEPETQLFLYSTLQDTRNDDKLSSSASSSTATRTLPAAEEEEEEEEEDVVVEHVLDLIAAIFARVRRIATATNDGCQPAASPLLLERAHGAMVGCLHEATFRLLVARRGLVASYWNPHDVWLFRVDELPPPRTAAAAEVVVVEEEGRGGSGLGLELGLGLGTDGLVWSVVQREDVPLIASRTSLPKVADTLMSEPSVAVRDASGMLVAWGFMGIAGTLSTLHVEEPYRGKGIAKALATKVLREHSFGDDHWGSADVHVDNLQSQGLCRSLGAKKGMRTCWTRINFDSMPLL